MPNRRSRGHSAGWCLSLCHLLSIFSGPQLLRAQRPLRPDVAFPTTSRLQLRPIFNSTRRYGHVSTPSQFLPISGDRDVSLPLSLEWPVWSSSSGNNCYAVQRSLFSGASLCSGTVGPSPCPILSALIRPRDHFRLLAIGMCHFLPVHHLGIAFLGRVEGQNTTDTNLTFIMNETVVIDDFRLEYKQVNYYTMCIVKHQGILWWFNG